MLCTAALDTSKTIRTRTRTQTGAGAPPVACPKRSTTAMQIIGSTKQQ